MKMFHLDHPIGEVQQTPILFSQKYEAAKLNRVMGKKVT